MITNTVKYNFVINLNDFFLNSSFIKNHSKHHIQSKKNSKLFARSLRSRLFGVISAFIKINIDLGISKTRKSNKQKHQIWRLQEWLYMCTQHTVILSSCKWNCHKKGYFVVKRYAVRKGMSPSWKWIVVHVLSLSGSEYQIKYNVTKVRKTTTFCLKHWFCKTSLPPL